MAESCVRAFGRYLRTLRERRGLSLEEVCSLSQTFPEKITKSYLSRCENGRQKLALAKLIPISRIYDVPAEVLIERMELDLELDRIGGPDTAGKSYAELADAAREMGDRGYRWEAYGLSRDALAVAASSPVRSQYRDVAEQVAIGTLNTGTYAGALGRNRFALHEFLQLENTGALSQVNHARALERIAAAYRSLGQLTIAGEYADRAIVLAETSGDDAGLAYMLQTRATIASHRGELESAIDLYRRCYSLHAQAHRSSPCASTLINLSQCYLNLGRSRAARQACEGALRLLDRAGSSRSRAAAFAILGIIEETGSRPEAAKEFWHQAATIAHRINDRVLRFQIEFLLFQQAIRDDNRPAARAIHRRLTRLSPWVPNETEELGLFRSLEVAHHEVLQNPVPGQKHEAPQLRN